MTLADTLKASILPFARGIPGSLGLRPHTVAVVISTWSGDYPGLGTKTEASTALVEGSNQPPKVRLLNGEELAVGQLASGTIEVGPITSTDAALAALKPALTAQQTIHLRVTGPITAASGDLYTITDIKMDRALHFLVQAKPVEQGT